jgi:sugar/nucleoside kinase (ribokinase family)
VIATDGAEGATWFTTDGALSEPGVQVAAIDTNGAGDIFAGCILYALKSRMSRRETLRFANRVAGYSCTQRGNSALPELDRDLFFG